MKNGVLKVLQVFGEPLAVGGQETFVLNMYKNIDRNKIQFDFFTPYFCSNKELKKEIEALGGIIFEGKGKFAKKGNKKDFVKNIKYFFSENKYDIVHIHSGSTFALCYAAKIARKSGAKKVIVHSHCAERTNNLKHKFIKKISQYLFNNYPTTYIACSTEAGKSKFSNKIINSSKFTILNNAIDYKKFIYNQNHRKEIRNSYNIKEDEIVIGHVGRFSTQKNHTFILEILRDICKSEKKFKMIFVGTGELENTIKEIVKEYKIEKNVIFLGIRYDTNKIYQAFDLFILPSIYEGLPIVGVEAQAAGLKCLFSENITKETAITENCKFLPLKKEVWKEEILKFDSKYKRENLENQIKQAKYDINSTIEKIEKIYIDNL